MKFPYDLGRKSDFGSPCCPEPATKEREVYYPSVFISGSKDLDLPKEGTMLVRFKRNVDSETVNRDDKTTFDVSFDVVEILSVEKASSGKKDDREDGDSALDKLKAMVMDD